MNKEILRSRLNIACINAKITRREFVMKWHAIGILHGKDRINCYRYISNMLSPDGAKIQPWLITAIEMQENENAKH